MSELLGVILAGGRSTRMGQDKATLPYKGARLIDHIADRMAGALGQSREEILVSGQVSGFTCITDQEPGLGPVAGIFSSLQVLNTQKPEWVLFVPVDMPELCETTLKTLCSAPRPGACEMVCFEESSLPALIRCSDRVLAVLKSFCDKKTPEPFRSVKLLSKMLRTKTIDLPVGFQPEQVLLNVNTPEQWSEWT